MIRREDPGAGELGYLAHYGSETWYIGNLVGIKPRAMTTMRGFRVWGTGSFEGLISLVAL